MKIKRTWIQILLLTLTLLLLTSCAGVVKTPTDLIRKPIVPRGGEFLQDVITTSLPDGAALIRPITQDLSSIDYINLLPNKKNNIYAFYKDKNRASVGAIILDNQENQWQPISIIEETASDIVLAEFTDFNGDGARDLIMGLSISDEHYNSLNFYTNNNGEFNRVYQDRYTDFVHQDLDGDGVLDVVLLTIDRNNTASAKVLTFDQKDALLKDELVMDEYNSGYYNYNFGKIDAENYGIVLDKKNGATYATNIIRYDGQKLSLAFDESIETQVYEKTFKYAPLKSDDINGDGIIEIARFITPKFYEAHTEKRELIPYLYGWYQLGGANQLELVKLTYKDEQQKFTLNLPDRWLNAYKHGEFSLIKSPNGANQPFITFYYAPDNGKIIRLYTLLTVDEDAFERQKRIITNWGGHYFVHHDEENIHYLGQYYPDIKGLNKDEQTAFMSLLANNQELRAFFEKIN